MKLGIYLILILILILSILSYSCKPKHKGEIKPGILSNFVSITDNEDKGIKEILSYYGGYCEYGMGKTVLADKKTTTSFWIKLSKSSTIDSLSEMIELPASNIAYLFYKHLDKERNNYTNIQSNLIFNGDKSVEHNYNLPQLEKVKSKILLVLKIVDKLKIKDYKALKNYLNVDTTLFNFSKDLLIVNLQKMEPAYGDIKEFVPLGFKFSQTENDKEILHISGLIKRYKQNNYFSVTLDPNSSQDEVYVFNYTL